METTYYRWLLIDNQETCYPCIVKLLDGMFKNYEDVQRYYKDDYCFKEHLFSVVRVDFSATPEWIAIKTGEILENK